jgi:para-nitrobenzyl esterase
MLPLRATANAAAASRGNIMKSSFRATIAIVGALATLAGAASAAPAPVKVHIDSGVLVGTVDGQVESFKGVPNAAAPVGSLRWAPPKAPAAWAGDRLADQYGLICPQPVNANGIPNEGGAFGASGEDCLFLNVWAPKAAHKAPVMLWIHGGSNTVGAGSLGAYDGSAFVRDGVIVVSINYRLGLLGFFAHPALTKAARSDEPLANYGVMDQIAALKWVQRNIAAFGGDPANVTVFGESAGGVDILALMASPKAKGLFAKAVVESGGGWGPPDLLADQEAKGAAAAIKAGAPPNATVEQLRALPVSALTTKAIRAGPITIDGRMLKESPSQAFADGHAADVPLMIGSNSFEASLMALFGVPASMMLATVPAQVKAAYADKPTDEAKAHAIFTDAVMGGPARWIAGKESSGQPAYLYHFSYVLDVQRPTSKGAGHASEIPYVFNSWDTLGALRMGMAVSEQDMAVTRLVHACWASFAKTGAPHCGDGPAWPAYTPANDTLMEFDTHSGLQQHFRKPQLDVEEARALPTLKLAN